LLTKSGPFQGLHLFTLLLAIIASLWISNPGIYPSQVFHARLNPSFRQRGDPAFKIPKQSLKMKKIHGHKSQRGFKPRMILLWRTASKLLLCSTQLTLHSAYSNMNMKAICSSETLEKFYQNTWRHVSADSTAMKTSNLTYIVNFFMYIKVFKIMFHRSSIHVNIPLWACIQIFIIISLSLSMYCHKSRYRLSYFTIFFVAHSCMTNEC
jgi:hypothetical protein